MVATKLCDGKKFSILMVMTMVTSINAFALQAGAQQHVLTCTADGCITYLVSPSLLQVVKNNPAATCVETSSSRNYVELVKQAHLSLQESWFEPGYPSSVLARATPTEQRCHLAGSVTPHFEHLVSCSAGLGRYFDAVLYDEGLQQWCLVPNAYLRDKAAAA